ncbi:MAG TPA: serine hydrolase domain-containing protein [Chthoniobacteraceae bacterium]|nr:serine hydrolase domain-containing protein [Chthoniobacteraceae bacterium]
MSNLQSALEPVFQENFSVRGELGASVSVWREGREIVSLSAGARDRQHKEPWTTETMVLVYSATKGPAAACVLKCLFDAAIPLDAPVAGVWPRFALAGKEKITFAQVLSHQAGLAALDHSPDVFDHAGVIRELEQQAPLWQPGRQHGYHPRTSGYLWDEIVRRVTGMALGHYWRKSFAEPLGLDFWMGLPAGRLKDVATLHAPRVAPPEDDFLKAFAETGSLTNRAFSCPTGLLTVSSMNSAAARMSAFPAFGGIGSASALARLYGMLAGGGEDAGRRYLAPGALEAMSHTLTSGFDLVLRMDNAFSAGFLQDPVDAAGKKLRASFGPSARAFGQVGAGGSVGFADPDRAIGFAYVMNQMEPGVLPNAKSLLLIQRMYEALDHGTVD